MFTGRTNTDGRGRLVKQRLKAGDGRGPETNDASLRTVWKLSPQEKRSIKNFCVGRPDALLFVFKSKLFIKSQDGKISTKLQR